MEAIESDSNSITWLLGDNSTAQVGVPRPPRRCSLQDGLPYRLLSSDVRCRYCFAYWARQRSQKPANLYSACCSS